MVRHTNSYLIILYIIKNNFITRHKANSFSRSVTFVQNQNFQLSMYSNLTLTQVLK